MTYRHITLLLIVLTRFSFGQNKSDSLIVFVGQRIGVTYSPQTIPNDTIIENGDTLISQHLISDSRFICLYKVLRVLNGPFKNDTISFVAYDHYGVPAFSKYETVLLFVSIEDGELFHEKYQYFDIYKTTNGRWAGPYSGDDYNHPFKRDIKITPEVIHFESEVSIDISKLDKEDIAKYYPPPFYKIKGSKAIAVYGNYIEDLFLLKQQTVLKARGIY